MKKFIIRALLFLTITLVTLLTLAASAVYFYQDELIGLFVEEANKKLRTPVSVGKIELTIWESFPRVALTFHDINVTESFKGSHTPLLKAQKLYFTFGLLEFIDGHYEIKRVVIKDGEINIRNDKNGQPNYLIIAPDTQATDEKAKAIRFGLKQVKLESMLLNYSPDTTQQYSILARKLQASLKIDSLSLSTSLDGQLFINKIKNGNNSFLANKEIGLQTAIHLDKIKNKLTLKPSTIQIEKSEFGVSGTVETKPQTFVNLAFEGKNTSIQTLLSLMPADVYDKVREYKSEGDVYFEGDIKGAVSDTRAPAVTVRFGCQNVSFYHPDFKKSVEKAGFKGVFSNDGTGQLEIKELRGLLDDKLFEAHCLVQNFKDPTLEAGFTGEFDIESLLALFPQPNIEYANGHLNVSLDFKGRVADLKNAATARQTNAEGELSIQNLNFKLKHKSILFNNLEGNFIFNKNDIAISGCQGQIGSSDFALDGYFKNSIAYLLFPEEGIRLDARFKSQNLNLDELLSSDGTADANASDVSPEPYKFVLPPKLALRLQCEIDKLYFRQFKPRSISGTFTLIEQQAISENFSMKIAGGQIGLTGTLNAQKPDNMWADLQAKFNKIETDSVFYLFEDFGQKFLTHKQIRGQLTTDMRAKVWFNENLEIDKRRLTAEVATVITNGQLNDFEPMQKLSKFIDRNELSNLRFAELKNTFRVENETLFIPEMEIKSNAFTVSVMGTQTFDKKMDYKLKVPLNSLSKDKDAAFGAIQDDGLRTNVLLTIKGTTDDFKIAYDKQAAKEKVKETWKKEKEEFKNLFRKETPKETEKKAEEKKKEQKKQETEFFDF